MDYWGVGGQRVCWPPPLKLLGGGEVWPLSSYAYVALQAKNNIYRVYSTLFPA